jgi:hypothetical protein
MQVGSMLASGRLPHQLVSFLLNKNIIKVGRGVAADLKYLHAACYNMSTAPFSGALDLGGFAKDRQLVTKANCSLADLTAAVLQKRLSKNISARVSSAWEDSELSSEVLSYAALDAYAALLVHQTLIHIEPPKPLPTGELEPRTAVILYHSDLSRVICRGYISMHVNDSEYDGIRITPKRTIIEVTEVLVPGAVIGTHRKRPLQSFGAPIFALVCLRSHLRVAESPNGNISFVGPTSSSGGESGQPSMVSGADSIRNIPPAIETTEEIQGGSEGDLWQPQDGVDEQEHDCSFIDVLFDNINTDSAEHSANTSESRASAAGTCEVDEASVQEGCRALQEEPNVWATTRSLVVNDALHIFKRIYIPPTHALSVEFARALRDAIFIPDEEDKQRISAYALRLDPPISFDALVRSRPAWVWQRCKRIIPPPEKLYPLVKSVFQTYGSLKDAKTAAPLFNSAAWNSAKNVLKLIQDGYLSDPPNIPLYSVIGIDSKNGGLPIYRCCRGTNFTEGGVHTHLRSHLPTSGVSVRHLHASLLDFIIRHNLLVCEKSTSVIYQHTKILAGWDI